MATNQAPTTTKTSSERGGVFRALIAGYRAGRSGKGLDTNPYPPGALSFAWVRGFGQGMTG